MNRKRGYLYILLAAMIYSTTEVALKGLGGVFAPMQITVERVLIGALFMLPFALRSLRRTARGLSFLLTHTFLRMRETCVLIFARKPDFALLRIKMGYTRGA